MHTPIWCMGIGVREYYQSCEICHTSFGNTATPENMLYKTQNCPLSNATKRYVKIKAFEKTVAQTK